MDALNELLYTFAQWLSDQETSQALIGSFYMWNWVEATHVLTLMISLGMLFIIDFRMLGWSMTIVPAATVADRLAIPMFVGFAIMFFTGFLLYYANALHETRSIWFRLKLILLLAAGINAWLFHKAMHKSLETWNLDKKAPARIRLGAGLSLVLWSGVIIMGRLMAYNWYDCDIPQGEFITWAVGCNIE